MTETKQAILPPFVQEYTEEGAVLALNTGHPVRFGIVYNYLLSMMPVSVVETVNVWAFVVAEGFLFKHELDENKYPTLHYYLNNRGNQSISALWEAWGALVDIQELNLLTRAHVATRRHPLETMAELPLDEKKSASSEK